MVMRYFHSIYINIGDEACCWMIFWDIRLSQKLYEWLVSLTMMTARASDWTLRLFYLFFRPLDWMLRFFFCPSDWTLRWQHSTRFLLSEVRLLPRSICPPHNLCCHRFICQLMSFSVTPAVVSFPSVSCKLPRSWLQSRSQENSNFNLCMQLW